MHIFVVDNSGSNRRIAKAIMERAGNITGVLHSLLPNAAVGFLFFSDHCDGSGGLFQEVGYTPATPEGEEALRASIANLQQAVGGDAPEAIECALMRASRYNFGSIPKNQRFLYLITDVVAHGMGMKDDNGCPDQVDWRRALRRVYETYNSFQVIASGDDADTFELQKQFISPERLRFDLMDLASDARLDHAERCELVPNACLFLAARNRGIQTVGAFLTGLYETWLASNRYGAQTAPRARKQIGQMALHYLEAPEAELRKMLERVFGDRFTDY